MKQYKRKTTKLKNIEIICVGFAKCLFLPESWQNFNFGLLLLINNITVTTNLSFLIDFSNKPFPSFSNKPEK